MGDDQEQRRATEAIEEERGALQLQLGSAEHAYALSQETVDKLRNEVVATESARAAALEKALADKEAAEVRGEEARAELASARDEEVAARATAAQDAAAEGPREP